MKRSRNYKFIWMAFVVVIFAVATWINKMPEPSSRPSPVHEREEPMTEGKVSIPSSVRELLPHADYKGPTIQLDFADENGSGVSLDDVYIGPLTDGENAGGSYALNGANSLKVAYVDRPAKGREIRAGVRYQAYKSIVVNGRWFFRRTEFIGPELEAGKITYRIKLVLSNPPKERPVAPVMPFLLEGIAPETAPEIEAFHISYQLKGRDASNNTAIGNGEPFKMGVEALGGDLVFTDKDRRVVYGLKLAVASPKIGRVESIRGHRKYRYFRTLTGGAEIAEFFPMDQARVPLSCAVIPPGRQDAEFAAVPGKYRVRICSEENFESRAEMPFIEFTLADQPDVRLR